LSSTGTTSTSSTHAMTSTIALVADEAPKAFTATTSANQKSAYAPTSNAHQSVAPPISLDAPANPAWRAIHSTATGSSTAGPSSTAARTVSLPASSVRKRSGCDSSNRKVPFSRSADKRL
jgi:hypothetical protein